MFLSLLGVWLNAKKKISCWIVWLASNIGWAIYNYATHQIAPLILVIILFFANLFGLASWLKEAKS